jgi:hypothetical protein
MHSNRKEVQIVDQIDPARVSADKTPSVRQAYVMLHLALDLLGYEWPESRRDATVLISALDAEAR